MIKVSQAQTAEKFEHPGSVVSVEGGHLHVYDGGEVAAVYAPGFWTSAVVAEDAEGDSPTS